MADNFIARQTLNGLGTFSLMTAPATPATGLYFIDGQLTLPTLVDGGGVSAVVATVYVDGVAQYTGVAGALGFQTKLTLLAGNVVTIGLASAATPDQGLNAVRGVVSAGIGT